MAALANDCCYFCVSFHIPYFLFLPHILQLPVLSFLFRTFPPKILLDMPASGLSSSVLPPLYPSLYCGFSLDLRILPVLCLMRLSLLWFYLDFPENFIYILTICFFLLFWFLFIQCFRFCFEFDASAASVCIFVVIWFDLWRMSYVTSLARRP